MIRTSRDLLELGGPKETGMDLLKEFLLLAENRNDDGIFDEFEKLLTKAKIPKFSILRPQRKSLPCLINEEEKALVEPLLRGAGGCQLEQISHKNRILELANLKIPAEVCVMVSKQLSLLTLEGKFSGLFYLGKVTATKGDYHIIIGDSEGWKNKEESLNSKEVFASVDLRLWVRLPAVKAGDIRSVRQRRVVFEGSIDSENERKALKSSVLRVLFGNCICPEGMFRPCESEAKAVELNPDFEMSKEALRAPEGWVYWLPPLRKYGDPRVEVPGIPVNLAEKIEAADPPIPRLKKLTEDDFRTWNFRLCGSPNQPVEQRPIVISNSDWPEFVTVLDSVRGVWTRFYSGFGFKKEPNLLLPSQSRLPLNEPKQSRRPLAPEPNPTNDNDLLETDSEPEKDKDD